MRVLGIPLRFSVLRVSPKALMRGRLSRNERFLQKRVDDILRYLEKADECMQVSNVDVGVNSKGKLPVVGDEDLPGDPLALQILWNLKANALMTMGELATVLGREKRTIERKVRNLREEGRLRRVGSDKSGSWKVIE